MAATSADRSQRDKAFFFFNFNDSRIISSELVQRTVPLDSLRNGNINYCTNASTDCSTQNTLSPAQVQAFDPAGIGEDSSWVSDSSKRFPHSNNTVTGDGVNSGGYSFNAPNNDYATNYVARIDYNLNDKMKLFGRFTISRENAVENPNEFARRPGDESLHRSLLRLCDRPQLGDRRTTRRTGSFSARRFRSSPSRTPINPTGSTFFTFGDGADQALSSTLYLNPSAQARRIPIPVIGDDFCRTKGTTRGSWAEPSRTSWRTIRPCADYNTTEVGLGGQILGLCGPTARQLAATGNPSLRPADIDPTQRDLLGPAIRASCWAASAMCRATTTTTLRARC